MNIQIVSLAMGATLLLFPSARAQQLYYDYRADLSRLNVITGDISPVASGVQIANLVVDADREALFWTDTAAGTIFRSNLDGSGIEQLFPRSGRTLGLALDSTTGYLYWSDIDNSQIKRINPDTLATEVIFSRLGGLGDLAIDSATETLYWVEDGFLVSSPIGGLSPVTHPLELEHLFFSDELGQLAWADADTIGLFDVAQGIEELLQVTTTIYDITVDPQGQRVYWSASGEPLLTTAISSVTVEGSRVEDVIGMFSFQHYGALAFQIPEPGGALIVGVLAILRRRRR